MKAFLRLFKLKLETWKGYPDLPQLLYGLLIEVRRRLKLGPYYILNGILALFQLDVDRPDLSL